MALRPGTCLVLTVTAALLGPSHPRAHGDADWIQHSKVWGWCCGPEDCRRAQPGEVVLTPNGFAVPSTHQIFRDGVSGFFQHNHDQDIWLCITGGIVRCLFIPERMT